MHGKADLKFRSFQTREFPESPRSFKFFFSMTRETAGLISRNTKLCWTMSCSNGLFVGIQLYYPAATATRNGVPNPLCVECGNSIRHGPPKWEQRVPDMDQQKKLNNFSFSLLLSSTPLTWHSIQNKVALAKCPFFLRAGNYKRSYTHTQLHGSRLYTWLCPYLIRSTAIGRPVICALISLHRQKHL